MMPSEKVAEVAGNGKVRIAGAILLVAVLIAYANSFSAPLIFDDGMTIQQNPGIRHLWPIWPVLSPPEGTGVGGRPIANLVFALNYAVSGESTPGFHAVNLAIHLLSGLALFGFARRTCRRIASTCGSANGSDLLALGIVALWLLHPLQTQSVTYVSQRTELLMGMFYLLTLYCFVRAAEPGASACWPVFTILSCVAGMGSKEGMVTAPVMVFLYDVLFVAGSFAEAWRQRWSLYVGLAASWAVLGLLMEGLHGRGVGFGHGMSAFFYLLVESRAVVRYAVLAFWPWPLVFDYGTDLGSVGWAEVGCALGLAALGASILWAFRRHKVAGFVGAWFFVTLAPTSSVIPIPLQPISENRMYLPMVAAIAGFVLVVVTSLRRLGQPLLAGISVTFVALTFVRNSDYRSETSIWRDTVAKRPESSRAHNNLGQTLQAAGRSDEARAEFERALQLRPQYADAHLNLAAVLGHNGDTDAALAHSRLAVQLDPQNAGAHYNLGVALREKGNLDDAITEFAAAAQLQPDHATVHDNLALLLLRTGRANEAVAHSEAAVRLNPGSIEARFNLACGLSLAGRYAEAVPLFQEIVRAQPDHVEARQNLGITLAQLGRPTDAAASFAGALRLDPNHVGAHYNLGLILLGVGDIAPAMDHLAAAVRLSPNFADARINFGIALAKAGRREEAMAQLKAGLLLNPNSASAREALQKLGATGGSHAGL